MFGMTERRSWEYMKNIIAYILKVCRKRKFLTILTHLKNKIFKIQTGQAMPKTI